MTGSSYIAIVVPIMAFTAMAFWLGLVFYADSHPGYGRRKSPRGLAVNAPHQAAGQLPAGGRSEFAPRAGTSDMAAASPEQEQIRDQVLAGGAR